MKTDVRAINKADEEIIESLERTVKELARIREFVIKTEIMTEAEVTEFINIKGEKYGRKYDNMPIEGLIFDLMSDMLEGLSKKTKK